MIAKKYYGKPEYWRNIFEANRVKLMKEKSIKPGDVLKIPKIENVSRN